MKDLHLVVSDLLADLGESFMERKEPIEGPLEVIRDKNLALGFCNIVPLPKEREEHRGVWLDLLENTAGELGARIYQKLGNRSYLSELDAGIARILKTYKNDLAALNLEEFEETLYLYFKITILHNALDCDSDELGERLIQVMGGGGLPCGYLGEWPNGKLVMYWPHKDEPTVNSTPPGAG